LVLAERGLLGFIIGFFFEATELAELKSLVQLTAQLARQFQGVEFGRALVSSKWFGIKFRKLWHYR